MEIQNVHVSGFKAIDEIEFEPGQITLVTGPNNSGKTSLLEAIQLGSSPISISKFEPNTNNIIRSNYDSSNISVEVDSYGEKVFETELGKPRMERATDEFIKSVAGNRRLRSHLKSVIMKSDNPDIDKVEEGIDRIGSSLYEHREVISPIASESVVSLTFANKESIYISGIDLASLPDPIPEKLRTELSDLLTNDRSGLERDINLILSSKRSEFVGTQPDIPISCGFINSENNISSNRRHEAEDSALRLSQIKNLLNKMDNITHIDTLSFDDIVFKSASGRYQVPYDFMGDGFQALVEILWSIFDTEELPDVLLLEEPDTHMHPEYVRQLVRHLVDFVQREQTQLFVTTHDIDFIRSFFDAVDPEQQEFLEEKFKLLKMDQELPEIYDYEEAREVAMDMQIDLRGR